MGLTTAIINRFNIDKRQLQHKKVVKFSFTTYRIILFFLSMAEKSVSLPWLIVVRFIKKFVNLASNSLTQ